MSMSRGFSALAARRTSAALLSLRRAGSSHAHGHDHHASAEPGGYFLGAPAKKPKYFWAPLYIWGYLGGNAVFLVAYFYSPSKSPSQVAQTEARKRLEASGETFGWPLPVEGERFLP
ncbi:hypothetical protein HDU84_007790 [Entophlyctis sp. JEL0112]|nr:hypothetical protein HDU84_007790 [Entophlyctis sp. JEL0112]